MSEDCFIKIENVTKAFGDFKAVSGISLNIPKGCFTTFLGPSGCGKTTLLRLIAGFYEPDEGQIFIEGNRVNGLPPYKRNTPLVFQEYALFPHMTVAENIAYGLKLGKMDKKSITQKVNEMLQTFGLTGLQNRFPRQLSGGQQQRVAFARAFVMGQKVLLLDEPLSNLDAKLRVEVRNELRTLQQQLGITVIYVTHDQDEALSMSDIVAVFDRGRIRQVGTPREIYFKPADRFVADFVGVANFIEGEVCASDGGEIRIKCGERALSLNNNGYWIKESEKVTLLIRPECVSIVQEGQSGEELGSTLEGEIKSSSFLGRTVRYSVEAYGMQFIIDDPAPQIHVCRQGKVKIALDKTKMHIIPA